MYNEKFGYQLGYTLQGWMRRTNLPSSPLLFVEASINGAIARTNKALQQIKRRRDHDHRMIHILRITRAVPHIPVRKIFLQGFKALGNKSASAEYNTVNVLQHVRHLVQKTFMSELPTYFIKNLVDYIYICMVFCFKYVY